MAQYLPIFVMLVLAIVFAVLSRVASRLLGPRNPTIAKYEPYECGIVPDREPPQRFPSEFAPVENLVPLVFTPSPPWLHCRCGLFSAPLSRHCDLRHLLLLLGSCW